MKTSEFVPIIVCEAFLLTIFAFIPVVRRQRAFFGVPVPPDFYSGTGRTVLTRYRVALAAIFVASVVLAAITSALRMDPRVVVLLALFTLAAALWRYALAYQNVRAFRIMSSEKRFASSLRTRRLRDYTSLPTEMLIAVLTFLPIITLALAYPHLPTPMPVHWNLAAQPDRWARKSFAAAFFLPILTIYLQSWLFLLKHDCVWLKMTLPAERAEEYQYKERALRIGTTLLDWTRLMLGLLLTLAALMTTTVIPGCEFLRPYINMVLWSSLALLIVGLAWLIARWLAVSNRLDSEFGFSMVERPGEMEHWHGGIFYFNRDDPAFFVEKLGGLGYTINCGHPRALVHLAALAGVPLFVVWALCSL